MTSRPDTDFSPDPAAYARLAPGMPAPAFVARSGDADRFDVEAVAGRYLVLCFLGTLGHPVGARRLRAVVDRRAMFDDDRVAFVGVSHEARDAAIDGIGRLPPGIRMLWDVDGTVGRRYGALPVRPAAREQLNGRWVVLNPNLQVRAVIPFAADDGDIDEAFRAIAALPTVDAYAGLPGFAPVLVLTDVLDPELCRQLVDTYRSVGGSVSGFMVEQDGRTVGRYDNAQKVRRDVLVADESVRTAIRARIERVVVPAIRRAFQFEATRLERYLVACYDAREGGHFRPHRDNTTRGTAHRRFALSVSLNDGFDGGDLVFPEFGTRTYRAPAGGAIVFSCSLLHGVRRVHRGERFALLPFLYDAAAERQRDANADAIADA